MASPSDLASMLAGTALFASLPAPALQAIASALRPGRYTPGQLLFSRGEPADGLYLVLSGRVRLSVRTPEGRELTVRIAEPGGILGEIAALDEGLRTADATALTPVEAMILPRARLAEAMDAYPEIARRALAFVCGRLRETTSQLEEVALYPIELRVARFLLSALDLFGKPPEGTGDVTLDMRLSQSELALLLGASRPKVNVALGAIAAAGGITRKGDTIVCHVAALRAFAGNSPPP